MTLKSSLYLLPKFSRVPFTIVLISRISTMVNGTLLNFSKRYGDDLTAVFFETGAMPVPTKSRNPTICGSGDPFHSYLTHS